MRLALVLWTATLLSPGAVRGQWFGGLFTMLDDLGEALSAIFTGLDEALEQDLDQQRPSGPFPCDVSLGRSEVTPTSVNRLRPGDFKVVGALGDSLTVGLGVEAKTMLSLMVPYSGRSWAIGGEGTWREYLTLPNILKEFNPSLVGYSNDEDPESLQLNVAMIGAKSSDLMRQARLLVRRIMSDSRVDVLHDWKFISLNIGQNDFCDELCKVDTTEMLLNHSRDMVEVLDYLRQHLPRTFVAVTPAANLKILWDYGPFTTYCKTIRTYECPCLFHSKYTPRWDEMQEVMDKWRKMDHLVADIDRYNSADDFAVVIQPFTEDPDVPMKTYFWFFSFVDPEFLSADCFHFSQETNARAANALWNNLLQPVGAKCTSWAEPFQTFYCPTKEHPYIFTKNNSQARSVPGRNICSSRTY